LDIINNRHVRDAYTILDILGKVGGIEKSLKSLLGIFFVLLSSNAMKVEYAKHLLLLKRKEVKLICDENISGD
jgi:hypothetical protein